MLQLALTMKWIAATGSSQGGSSFGWVVYWGRDVKLGHSVNLVGRLGSKNGMVLSMVKLLMYEVGWFVGSWDTRIVSLCNLLRFARSEECTFIAFFKMWGWGPSRF